MHRSLDSPTRARPHVQCKFIGGAVACARARAACFARGGEEIAAGMRACTLVSGAGMAAWLESAIIRPGTAVMAQASHADRNLLCSPFVGLLAYRRADLLFALVPFLIVVLMGIHQGTEATYSTLLPPTLPYSA